MDNTSPLGYFTVLSHLSAMIFIFLCSWSLQGWQGFSDIAHFRDSNRRGVLRDWRLTPCVAWMTGCGSCFPPVHIQRCHELGINGRVRGGGIANTDARMCFSSFYCEKPAATRRAGYQKYSPASLSSASYPLHLSVQLSQDWLPSAVNILYFGGLFAALWNSFLICSISFLFFRLLVICLSSYSG